MDIPSTKHKFKKGDIVARTRTIEGCKLINFEISEDGLSIFQPVFQVTAVIADCWVFVTRYDCSTGETDGVYDFYEQELELVDMKGANI